MAAHMGYAPLGRAICIAFICIYITYY